ncbi:MAG: hypothetical protein RLZZ53_424 [Acidobacteriota bacterium]
MIPFPLRLSSKPHGFATAALLLTCLAVTGCGDGPGGLTSPTPVVIGGGAANPGGAATLGFVQDIKPLLDGDCIRCHNTRNANGRVDLTTFTSVMRTVRAGSAQSELVRVTQQGGSMFREWSGDRAAKANLVRRWVVEFQARENR